MRIPEKSPRHTPEMFISLKHSPWQTILRGFCFYKRYKISFPQKNQAPNFQSLILKSIPKKFTESH